MQILGAVNLVEVEGGGVVVLDGLELDEWVGQASILGERYGRSLSCRPIDLIAEFPSKLPAVDDSVL
ncbi:MAG: hypothetical protein U5O39_06250 [Gammaproteobacteria bacterium]|nr:hypothetical protein [Gammaproteobacteria bacterium]